MDSWRSTRNPTPVAEPELAAPVIGVLERVEESLQRAGELLRRASVTCDRAARLRSASRLHRDERQAWAAFFSRLAGSADRRVAICAYCHRVRSRDQWIVLPFGIEGELKEWLSIVLSHTYCPECLKLHESELLPSGPPPAG